MSNYNQKLKGTYLLIGRAEDNSPNTVEFGALHNNGVLAPLIGSPLAWNVLGATMYANDGYLSPDGTAWARFLDSRIRDMFRMDTLYPNRDSFVAITDLYVQANPTGNEVAWDHGGGNNSVGGISFRLLNSQKCGFRHLPVGGTEDVFYSKGTFPLNTDFQFSVLIDGYNRSWAGTPYVTTAMQGRLEIGKPMTGPVGIGSTTANFGLIIAGQSGAATPSSKLNGNGSGARIKRILFMRVFNQQLNHLILPTFRTSFLDPGNVAANLLLAP